MSHQWPEYRSCRAHLRHRKSMCAARGRGVSVLADADETGSKRSSSSNAALVQAGDNNRLIAEPEEYVAAGAVDRLNGYIR